MAGMATWHNTPTTRVAPLRALTLTRHEDGVGPRNPPLIGRLPEGLGLAPLPVHDPLPAAPAPSVAEARERLLQLGGLMGRQKGPGPAMMLVRVPPLLDFIHRHRVAFSAS